MCTAVNCCSLVSAPWYLLHDFLHVSFSTSVILTSCISQLSSTMGHFTFWIKFGLSLKFGVSERLIQKVKSPNVKCCRQTAALCLEFNSKCLLHDVNRHWSQSQHLPTQPPLITPVHLGRPSVCLDLCVVSVNWTGKLNKSAHYLIKNSVNTVCRICLYSMLTIRLFTLFSDSQLALIPMWFENVLFTLRAFRICF